MDCSRAGWTDVFPFNPCASLARNWRISSRFLVEMQDFMCGRPGQHLIGLQFELSSIDTLSSIPRPRTLTDTNDTLRARSLHAVVAELDLSVTNIQIRTCTHDAAGRIPEMRRHNGLYHDFEETGSKTGTSTGFRLVGGRTTVLSLKAKIRYLLCETWRSFAWLDVRRHLAKSGRRDVDRLEKLE